MSTMQQPGTRRRGRPRNPAADSLVLEAALSEYAERGWAGFTMDAVARRAGVGKSTLYLRWADKDTLLLDAMTARSQQLWSADTGSLRGDLEELTAGILRHYQSPTGRASIRLAIDVPVMDSPWQDSSEALTWSHLDGLRVLLDRAVSRGELDEYTDQDELIHGLCGSVMMQALRFARDTDPLSEAEIASRAARTVGFLLSGAAGSESA